MLDLFVGLGTESRPRRPSLRSGGRPVGLLKGRNQDVRALRSALADQGLTVKEIVTGETKRDDLDGILNACAGVVLPGSDWNINPFLFGAAPDPSIAQKYDHSRDELSFPLITKAIDEGIPLLAICRGFQELQVERGGHLIQNIAAVVADGVDHAHGYRHLDYRAADVHEVEISPDGLLKKILGNADPFRVNSIHQQGALLEELASGLKREAWHGRVIEAASVYGHPFALGIQFHPEFGRSKIQYRKIFAAYANAVRVYESNLELAPIERGPVYGTRVDRHLRPAA